MAQQLVTSERVNWDAIRSDFPILNRKVHNKPLIFLDSAASSQKPNAVIAATVDAYENHYANVHRGLHLLSEEATDRYEDTRRKVANLINASSPQEVVLTSGATMSLNIIAQSYGGWF